MMVFMSPSDTETASEEFADLASRISAACAEAIEFDRVLEMPEDSLGQALSSLIRLYAAKAQLGKLPPAFGRNSGIAVTDVAIGCTAMMEAADLSLFDLGAWQSLAGVGRRIQPRFAPGYRGNVNDPSNGSSDQ
jgi:hypothetical protein